MNQVLLLAGLTLGSSQLALPAAAIPQQLLTALPGPTELAARRLTSPLARLVAGPASAQSTVHRATGRTPQVACGRANTAASARAKRLGTCVLRLATPESCKVANGLYTAEAVSADAKCYPAHPTHKPPVPLEQ